MMIISAVYLLVILLTLFHGSFALSLPLSGWSAISFVVGYTLFFTLVFFLYFIILEGLGGATVGKRLLGLRVVREDGSACGLGRAVVRNVLRIIDGLPFLYLLGVVIIGRSEKKQRLGDILAKTVVVRPIDLQGVHQQGFTALPIPSAEASKFCAYCGMELGPGGAFCPRCGAKL